MNPRQPTRVRALALSPREEATFGLLGSSNSRSLLHLDPVKAHLAIVGWGRPMDRIPIPGSRWLRKMLHPFLQLRLNH